MCVVCDEGRDRVREGVRAGDRDDVGAGLDAGESREEGDGREEIGNEAGLNIWSC